MVNKLSKNETYKRLVGSDFKKARESKGYTRKQLREILGEKNIEVSESKIQQLEVGNLPSFDIVSNIAYLLDVDILKHYAYVLKGTGIISKSTSASTTDDLEELLAAVRMRNLSVRDVIQILDMHYEIKSKMEKILKN